MLFRSKGVCKDAEGNPIADAVVVWANQNNGQRYPLKTNKKGEYFSLGIAAGSYTVTLYKNADDAKANKELFHFGPVGSGTAFKLIYNLMGVVQIVALAEGLAAAEAAGVDPRVAAKAFARGNTGSGHVVKHGPFMAEGVHEDPPGFTARGRVKDSTYGVQLEEKLGLCPRVGRAALAAYQEMVDLGMGADADSRLIDVVKRHQAKP